MGTDFAAHNNQNIIQAESTEKDWPGKSQFELEESIARGLLRQGFRGEDLTETLKLIMKEKS